MCNFVLATSDGAAVPAHAGLGSASEVGLATTRDQPTEARWRLSEAVFLFLRRVEARTRSSSCATSTGASKVPAASVSKYLFPFEGEMFGRSSARASSIWPPPGHARE